MKKIRCLIIVLFGLSFWSTGYAKSLGEEDSNRVRSSKTAVVVLDIDKRIAYDETTFYGVGVGLSKTSATYNGIFDLEKYAGDHFVKQFGNRGVKSNLVKFSADLWSTDLVNLYSDAKEDRVGETKNVEAKQILPAKWKASLSSTGNDFLFLSVIPTLKAGVSNFDRKQALVGMFSTMYLYDVKSGALLWSNTLGTGFGVPIENSAKDIESKDFASAKEAIDKSINFFFTTNRGAYRGIDVGLGLSSK